jgi:uncharacterized protein (TIGR03435 family)
MMPACRLVVLACLAPALAGCSGSDFRSGKVIYTEDSGGRYIQVREGEDGYVLSRSGQVPSRPDLKDLVEKHSSLEDLCRDFHGRDNPRIVIESTNRKSYQVVYKSADRDDVLPVIAKALGLEVTQEERDVAAITLRVAPGGHRLKPAAARPIAPERQGPKPAMNGPPIKSEPEYDGPEGHWLMEGITTEELARFLERRFRQPVVDLTGLEGKWSILLSHEGTRWPPFDKNARPVQPPYRPVVNPTPRHLVVRNLPPQPLDDLGLELFEQSVRLRVTVIKDAPSEQPR